MPFALALVAIILIVTGIRGTISAFLSEFVHDVEGVLVAAVAIFIIGAIGYIPGLKKISDGFLVLVLLAMVLTNAKNGLFQQFNSQIRSGVSSLNSSSTALQPLAPIPSVSLGMPQVLNQ